MNGLTNTTLEQTARDWFEALNWQTAFETRTRNAAPAAYLDSPA